MWRGHYLSTPGNYYTNHFFKENIIKKLIKRLDWDKKMYCFMVGVSKHKICLEKAKNSQVGKSL